MKIDEKLVRAYSLGQWIDDRAAKILRDALQQAVAENLHTEHKLYHWQNDIFTTCSHCHVDWLAEADKLLRGEK